MNNRRNFLKLTGLLGVSSLLPIKKIAAAPQAAAGSCTLIPTETAGPFPLDLTENTTFFRSDIRESKTGALLRLKLKIIGDGNCLPMQNVRVNIWHCDKDGLYSGYDNTMNAGQAGLTYLRGYQFTDANGEVNFVTVFPGWYTSRLCHIHFQVYVSSAYSAVSQLTFDVNAKNAVYDAFPAIYTKGHDPMTAATDNVFSDGVQYQTASLTADGSGAYDSYLEVTIQGNGVTGIGHIEKETAKQVVLGQNFPNPFAEQTTIPFQLMATSDVTLDLYDLQGKKVYSVSKNALAAGSHEMNLMFSEIGLKAAGYAYQIEVRNAAGVFRTVKMMTAQ